MTRQIPWLRVFVEGVVIVGSILLVFGIDAWWEGNQDSQLEDRYLERLATDRNLSTTMGHSTGLIREQCPVW